MPEPYFSLDAAVEPLVFAGAQDRYAKNVAALQLLRALQSADRIPGTFLPNELHTLAHYTAFGEAALLQRALAPTSAVVQLTTEAEQKLLKRSALTAFYTPPPVYHALWSVLAPSLRQLDGPLSVLEPAFGTGLAVATMPPDLRERATITAVELDDVTGQIASLLHPDVRLTYRRGFETVDLLADHFDLVISNVPFGDIGVFDPVLHQEGAFLTRTLHDYFIARSLLLTRPGGVVAVLSSYGTLDKRDARVRNWLAQRAELLGAYRLPQGVMNVTSGMASGADIVVLRRRPRPVHETPAWTETVPVELPIIEATAGHFTTGSRIDCDDPHAPTGVLRVARHFVDHPADAIGSIWLVRHNSIVWQAVPPPEGVDVPAALVERLQQLPQPLVLPATAAPVVAAPVVAPRRTPSSARVAGLLAIYDAAKAVLRRDTAGADASAERATLKPPVRPLRARLRPRSRARKPAGAARRARAVVPQGARNQCARDGHRPARRQGAAL